jgi:hypothetical protein
MKKIIFLLSVTVALSVAQARAATTLSSPITYKNSFINAQRFTIPYFSATSNGVSLGYDTIENILRLSYYSPNGDMTYDLVDMSVDDMEGTWGLINYNSVEWGPYHLFSGAHVRVRFRNSMTGAATLWGEFIVDYDY